jgi:hypothetical protein
MMKKRWMGIAFAAICTLPAMAQESEWEPQSNITGYIATEANYFDNIKGYDRDYAVGLTEAGLLASFQPTANITLKGVFVYRPDLSVDQMINEANAQWRATDFLNVKVGRFLTPLSPMNTYYYAPVNNSATLPMIISHHEFFPLNMDGLSLNGAAGEQFKVDYDLFAGGFRNTLWLKTGALGLFGSEDNYFGAYQNIPFSMNTAGTNATLGFGGGAHVGFSWNDYITIGGNVLKTATQKVKIDYYLPTGGSVPLDLDMDRFIYGINFKAKYKTLQLLGEVWKSDNIFTSATTPRQYEHVNGSFFELSNQFGKLTPYVRYEDHDAAEIVYQRYTAGLNYKPIFETTFKLEYMHYNHKSAELNGLVASVIYSF